MKYTPPSGAGDARRHRNWCEHLRKSDTTCWCKDSPFFGIRCCGSAYCVYYSSNKDRAESSDEMADEDSAVADNYMFLSNLVGKTIRHDTFGIGTITDVSDQILTVLFETAGTKKLSLNWCVRKGMIQPEVFTNVSSMNLYDLLALARPKMPDGSPVPETEWVPADPPPRRKISPEKIAKLRAYVNCFAKKGKWRIYPPSAVCADMSPPSDRFNEHRKSKVFRDLTDPVAWHSLASPPIPQPKPSFQKQFLVKLIEREMTTVECYSRANVDRKLFSKIMSREGYVPRKEIALALILTLRPSPCERDELLQALGYSLSESSKYDLIIRYCSEHGIFDIDEINGYLYEINPKWKLLGSSCE